MEVFGTVTAAIGVLDQSRQLVRVLCEQYRHMKKVPRKCVEFDKRLNETNVTLRELKGYKAESMTPMATREVNRMSEYLKDAKSKLERLKRMTEESSKMGRWCRGKRVSEALDELIDELEKLKVPGLVIDSSAHQASLLQASSSAEKDMFTLQYNVPPTLPSSYWT